MRKKEDHKKILSLWDSGMTKMEIVKAISIPWSNVWSCINKYNSLKNYLLAVGEANKTKQEDAKVVYDYYIKDNKSIKNIMKLTKFTRGYISKLLNEQNIQILSSAKIRIKNSLLGTDLNYFNEMTSHAAYVLGLIWGDGCVHHNDETRKYFLNITSEDKDILDSANIYFGGKFTVKQLKYSKAQVLNIWSKELTELLYNKYGLRGEKAHNLKWIDLPHNMYQYFISGLHSADGSNYNQNITSKHKGKTYLNKTFVWQYTTVCYDFICQVKQFIEDNVDNITPTKLLKRTHQNGNLSYSIRYSGKNAIKLCNWMYNDTNHLTRCERKYNIFLPWKDYKFHH